MIDRTLCIIALVLGIAALTLRLAGMLGWF